MNTRNLDQDVIDEWREFLTSPKSVGEKILDDSYLVEKLRDAGTNWSGYTMFQKKDVLKELVRLYADCFELETPPTIFEKNEWIEHCRVRGWYNDMGATLYGSS